MRLPRPARPAPADPRRTPSPGPSRRALVVGASGAAVAALAGCAGASVPAPVDDEGPARPADLAPDVSVAATALTGVREARAAVEATAARFPALAEGLAAVLALHAAHESALVEAVPERARTSAAPAAYAVPARRRPAVTRLLDLETRHRGTLDGLALSAESGAFARLLASMGAGVAQHAARHLAPLRDAS